MMLFSASKPNLPSVQKSSVSHCDKKSAAVRLFLCFIAGIGVGFLLKELCCIFSDRRRSRHAPKKVKVRRKPSDFSGYPWNQEENHAVSGPDDSVDDDDIYGI